MSNLAYLKTSWYCILAGKNYLSDNKTDDCPVNNITAANVKIKHLYQQKTASFPDHLQYLNSIFTPDSTILSKGTSQK